MAPSEQRYDAVTVALHWATALLVLLLFATAMTWSYAPRDWGLRWLSGIHVSLGIALAIAVVGRLVWRLTLGRRIIEVPANPVAHVLTRIVHGLLYALLLVQIVLGFSLEWLGGEALSFFGLFEIDSPFAENRDLGHQLEQVHGLIAWGLMALAGGHALAALWHRYVVKDDVLQRMLPSA
jgi:cytochrome b561